MRRFVSTALLLCAACLSLPAQSPVLIHSHNDYTRTVPFWEAYSQKVRTVECDMYHMGGSKFLVAHGRDEVRDELTFDRLYLEPIVWEYRINGGSAWADDKDRELQLMIDIKSDDTEAFLKALVKKLKRYPEVFDRSVNPHACLVIMTGNIPAPEDFDKYPSYITFDGTLDMKLTPAQLERITLFSEYFRLYSQWDGKSALLHEDEVKIRDAVAKAHSLGKPIRFWGSPDTVTCWTTWINFGIDYLNTDHPERCSEFVEDWQNRKN